MQAKGEWFTPTLDDVPNWYKPPLFYWSERVAYSVLGTTLLAARLPSVLAWIAVVLLVPALGRRMYGEERGTRARAYEDLNSASKARFRAKAVEILGVENRPARSKKKGKDI